MFNKHRTLYTKWQFEKLSYRGFLACKCLTRVNLIFLLGHTHASKWFHLWPCFRLYSGDSFRLCWVPQFLYLSLPVVLIPGRETFLSLFVFAAIWLPLGTLGFDIAANWLSFALLIRVKDILFLGNGCPKVWNSFPTRSCMLALYYSWTCRRFRIV